ncbi:putative glucan -beta-glucosidase protein [Botrytis fragariae]|uniref:Putative glucan -beta-glucosidase protein n=1 Tax=Botrytis fragariae TaxID=1964551 RepID=A0A8H6AFR5_9HELO|nr:putative glucan -beta-glucosidase protein [Botrytis fragariae]KAF5867506.1 putative glucan -beta-glucosidase protein [Botrytis fragariae]
MTELSSRTKKIRLKMKKLVQRAKDHIRSGSSSSQTSPSDSARPVNNIHQSRPSTISQPTVSEILRYRYHFGVNLGSIFVLEPWLFPKFVGGASSELDAVTSSVKNNGVEATRQKWEGHWKNAVTDQAFGWLAKSAKGTSIRLPVGYFTLGPQFCVGTPFESAKDVYQNSWTIVKEFITRARALGVGVLVDLHALPGGANTDMHSGSSTGKAELWGSKKNLELAKKALLFIAKECKELDGVIGIQLCNEACWDAGKKGMYDFYTSVIQSISEIDSEVPIYISDAWDLSSALKWTKERDWKSGKVPSNPVVIDTHKYYTFAEKHRSQSAQELIHQIPTELGELPNCSPSATHLSSGGETQIVIGEYSCVLDEKSWAKSPPAMKEELTREFGRHQCNKWTEGCSAGSYFWTWKMEWMDGGGWGFVEQVKKGNIIAPAYMSWSVEEVKEKLMKAEMQKDEIMQKMVKDHVDYWTHEDPEKEFRHDLYEKGWKVGWEDAAAFFEWRGEKGGADRLGSLEIWIKKRLIESGERGEFLWELEQGFRWGVREFENCVEIA